MESTNGKDRESVARKLRDLAQILEGDVYPADIVNRRAGDLRNDLAAVHDECHDPDLADFLKTALSTVERMTDEGRARIAGRAYELATSLNNDLEPKVSWRELAQLPVNDRQYRNRVAGQLRHVAGLLDAKPKEQIVFSRPVFQSELRNKLGITQNTLRGRLIQSLTPTDGKYRCRKATPKAKLVEVVIADLPESLHAWLREKPKTA